MDDLRIKGAKMEPILVPLDIGMSVMDGAEFLEFMVLEGFPFNIDVIIVTSSIAKGDRLSAERYPQFAGSFVTKPLNM